VIDDSYVDSAAEDAITQVRSRGRLSLSASGESLLLRVRLSHDLDEAVRRAPERSGEDSTVLVMVCEAPWSGNASGSFARSVEIRPRPSREPALGRR